MEFVLRTTMALTYVLAGMEIRDNTAKGVFLCAIAGVLLTAFEITRESNYDKTKN